MSFEFTPADDRVTESFWAFSIPAHGIRVPFLLVGLVAEPRLAFEQPAINFGQVLLGVRARQVRLGGPTRRACSRAAALHLAAGAVLHCCS